METHENGHRYRVYDKWGTHLHAPYDYERDGLIYHLMSHKITQTKNPILQSILSFYEQSLIYVMKYIDILKHFKDYTWKNR